MDATITLQSEHTIQEDVEILVQKVNIHQYGFNNLTEYYSIVQSPVHVAGFFEREAQAAPLCCCKRHPNLAHTCCPQHSNPDSRRLHLSQPAPGFVTVKSTDNKRTLVHASDELNMTPGPALVAPSDDEHMLAHTHIEEANTPDLDPVLIQWPTAQNIPDQCRCLRARPSHQLASADSIITFWHSITSLLQSDGVNGIQTL
jgi:hypothetical protein